LPSKPPGVPRVDNRRISTTSNPRDLDEIDDVCKKSEPMSVGK
jgi:hypothetical protein